VNTAYFVKDRLLAAGELRDDYAVASIAYFCCHCGEVWSRVVAGKTWRCIERPCEDHNYAGVFDFAPFPGSILAAMGSKDFVGRWAWAACIELLPIEVLKRELEIHINCIERKYHEEASEVLGDSSTRA
jgi:hypothetical protein